MTWYAIKWTTLSMVCAAVPRRRWSDCQMGRRNVAIRQDLRLRKIYEYVLAYLSNGQNLARRGPAAGMTATCFSFPFFFWLAVCYSR